VNRKAFKADMKMISRDPIMIMLMLIPILMVILIKIILCCAVSFFDFRPYYGYVLGLCLLISPMMLGVVAGFLMIDEKDGKIFELISITPIGYLGYIIHRLILPFVGSIIYTILIYFMLDIYMLEIGILLYLIVMIAIESLLIGVILFVFADDKVKGLTYSKGLSVFIVLSMSDLFNKQWLSIVAGILPFYWIVKTIHNPRSDVIFLTLLVHLFWLCIVVKKVVKMN